MSVGGQLKKIGPGDVPGAPSWMNPVFAFLNQIVELVNRAFANGLTFRENLDVSIVELQINTLSTYSSGEFTVVKFDSGIGHRADGVEVLQVIDRDLPDAVLSGNWGVDWRDSSGEISVRWISGLQNTRRYFVRLRVS